MGRPVGNKVEGQLWAVRRQWDPPGHHWGALEGDTGEAQGSLGELESRRELLGGSRKSRGRLGSRWGLLRVIRGQWG